MVGTPVDSYLVKKLLIICLEDDERILDNFRNTLQDTLDNIAGLELLPVEDRQNLIDSLWDMKEHVNQMIDVWILDK
jgi:hypothetical protein